MRLLCVPGRSGGAGRGPWLAAYWPQHRGMGQAGGRTWPEGVWWRRRRREHGSGPVELGAWAGTPRRLVSARAARARDRNSHARPEENGAKVCSGSPTPTACLCPVCALPEAAAGATQTSKQGPWESLSDLGGARVPTAAPGNECPLG